MNETFIVCVHHISTRLIYRHTRGMVKVSLDLESSNGLDELGCETLVAPKDFYDISYFRINYIIVSIVISPYFYDLLNVLLTLKVDLILKRSNLIKMDMGNRIISMADWTIRDLFI